MRLPNPFGAEVSTQTQLLRILAVCLIMMFMWSFVFLKIHFQHSSVPNNRQLPAGFHTVGSHSAMRMGRYRSERMGIRPNHSNGRILFTISLPHTTGNCALIKIGNRLAASAVTNTRYAAPSVVETIVLKIVSTFQFSSLSLIGIVFSFNRRSTNPACGI